MFREIFLCEDTLVGPRGKSHRALGRCKRKFCGSRGPDARAGPDPRTLPFGAGIREGLFLAFQTDFEDAHSPRNNTRAQHINRGAGLAPGGHQDSQMI